MTIQDYLIQCTREAMEEAFRYARATPDDKLEWSPLESGQTTLSMLQELARCPDWALDVLGASRESKSREEEYAEMRNWKSVAECEAILKLKLESYFTFLQTIPEDRFSENHELPFGPGGSMRTFSLLELMDYPRWNASYHQGQIAYIQTLFGDKGMH